jgi:hypothetical protein
MSGEGETRVEAETLRRRRAARGNVGGRGRAKADFFFLVEGPRTRIRSPGYIFGRLDTEQKPHNTERSKEKPIEVKEKQ